MKRLVLATGILVAVAMNASAIIIDHFELPVDPSYTGGYSSTIASPAVDDEDGVIATVWGGYRRVVGNITANPGNALAAFKTYSDGVATHQFQTSFPTQAQGTSELAYGSFTAGAAGGLNYDMTSEYGIGMDLVFCDINSSVTVEVDAGGTIYSTTQALPPTTTPLGYSFPWTTFPNLVSSGNLADVDGLRFVFSSTDAAWDLTIDDISTERRGPIPEPATMSLLGLGLLAIARRRRQKKS